MDFELIFGERSKYLLVRITAPTLDRASALGYLSEVASRCADNRCKLLMLERHAEVSLSEADLYQTVAEFVSMSSGLRVALVNAYQQPHDALRNTSEIGRGMGADYKCFTDRVMAEKWLLEER